MKRKILIIEDNEQNIYLLTFLLEKNGYSVIQARNGMDSITLAQTDKPDLILLDIQLPVMNGYSVARALKKVECLQHVKIIAVTSYAMPGDKEQALSAGCSGYIEKPIDPNKFISQIEQHFSPDIYGGKNESHSHR